MRQASRAIVIKDDKMLLMKRNKHGHEYFATVGGAIDPGEKPIETLIRELKEETTITVSNPRLVVIEDAGQVFGMEYIFLCDYESGDPALDPSSIEYQINQGKEDMYEPMWINLSDLPATNLLPRELKSLILQFLKDGFPDQPINLKIEDTNNI